MKIKYAALTLSLLLASEIPALAKKSSARPFFLPQTVTLDGAEIPKGMYQFVVENENPGVRVELWKDGRFIATTHGAWVKSGIKYGDNSILLRVNPDGSRSLIELRLAGTAKTIVLKNPATATVQYTAK